MLRIPVVFAATGPGNMYNTIMAVAAAAGMLLVVVFAFDAGRTRNTNFVAWAWAFAPLGLILTVTGVAMSVTWPLQKVPASLSPHCCVADNIIFGEPSLFFGAILLAFSGLLLYLQHVAADNTIGLDYLISALRPLAFVAAFASLTLFPIAAAGAYYGMFGAPPSEPFSSMFRNNHLETAYVVIAYFVAGVGGLLTAATLYDRRLFPAMAGALGIAGLMFLWIGLVSYYGHIALS